MSDVESKILEMQFKHEQFESGIRSTLAALDNLNKGLKLEGAAKGINDVDAAVRRVSLQRIADGVENISQKFTALGITAITTIANIANRMANMGINFAKQFTVEPIKQGLQEYETNLNAVQTILANTSAAGTKLKDVNGALAELNTYSDQTIYNFSEMARNIGTFTAAGVDLKTATAGIKGIANLAALSGSNSQQASTAMYQLSQAISAGRVNLQDWNSVVNAGMGGAVFQRALAQTAQNMGTLKDGAVKLSGPMKNVTISGKSFRESITAKPGQESWLTSKVLTATLAQFTGDLTDADLAAQGFSKSQIKAIQDQAKMAKAAATEVKTATQLVGTLKESAGSGWSNTWQLIFGDFEQAKKLWTGVNNVLGGMIGASADARNNMLKDWSALGGRTALIDSVSNAFKGLMSVVAPIKKAFSQIFPPMTGKQLADITKAVRDFTKGLTLSKENSENLRRTFAGVFAIFGIVAEIIKEVVGLFLNLTSGVDEGATSILGFTANIGDFLVRLLETVRSGTALHDFFTGLATILKTVGSILLVPIHVIQLLGKAIGEFFARMNPGGLDSIGSGFSRFGKAIVDFFAGINMAKFNEFLGKLLSFDNISSVVSAAWQGISLAFSKAKEIFGPVVGWIVKAAAGVGTALADFFSGIDYSALLATINTGLFAGLVLMVRNFLKNFGKSAIPEGGGLQGFVDDITGPFKQLTGTLEAMQNTLKALTLLQIAAAVALLAVSVVQLSKVDAEGLNRATAALAVLFGQLVISMAVFQKIDIKGGMMQLILVALALRILTQSVMEMATLDWNSLAKGLTGTAVLLISVAAAARLMPDGKRMASAGVGLILMATAIRILADSVKTLSDMSWEDMTRGLIGVGAMLAALGLYSKLVSANKMGVIQGAGIILLAVGLKMLADVVTQFATMSWGDMAKGMVGMAVALDLIGGALEALPASSVLSAVAIFIAAQALTTIGKALAEMGKMSWADIASGLTAMAGALAIIAGGMYLMTGALPGALALIVVAASLKILAPVLADMGKMSWADIASGLTLLAGALVIIAVGVTAMALALPGAAALVVIVGALAALAPVLGMFGAMSWADIASGLTLLAGALVIIAVGVTAMALALPGAAALVVVAGALAILAPILVVLGSMSWADIGKGLLTLAGAFVILGVAGYALTPVIPTLLGLAGAIALLGVGVALIGVGVLAFATGLTALAVSGGAATIVLVGLVTAMIGLLPQIASAIGAAVISFARTIAAAGPAIMAASVTVMTAFMNGIIKLAPKIGQTFMVILTTLLRIIDTMAPRVVATMLRLLSLLLSAVLSFVPRLVTAGMTLITSILNGIAARIGGVITAAVSVIVAFINGIGANIGRVVDAGVKLIVSFINGVANSIRNNTAAMNAAGQNLASAIVQGMSSGLFGGIGAVIEAAKSVARSALSAAKSVLGIHSPSREFAKLGKFSAEGYAKGLDGSRDQIVASQKAMTEMLASAKAAILKDIDSHTAKLKRLNAAKKKDISAIKATTAALKESRAELAKVNKATGYSKSFGDEMKKLNTLGIKAETVAKKLSDAKQKLADATKTRDDYTKSITEQYSKLGSFDKETKLSDYVKDMQKQIVDTQIFASQLQELRKRGLNDEMYKDLLAKGVDAIPFVKQILEGGAGAIKELNTLESTLAKNAKALGNSASKTLYQAAVDSAAGLVKGLQSQQNNIEKEMDKIAGYMVRAIKKSLGIKSPSRVLMEIGDYSMQGLAKGLTESKAVAIAATSVGDDIVERMRKSLSSLDAGGMSGDILNPTIRPVLDLSDINKNAGQLGKMLAVKPLDVGLAYSQAAATLTALAEKNKDLYSSSNTPETVVNFNQYNNSPKALSQADIYRNTKNQISRAKGVLATK